MQLRQKIHKMILEIPGIELKKSRISKSEAYFYNAKEIAHFHNNNEIDIRVTRGEISKQGWRKNTHPLVTIRSINSDWAEISFRKEADIIFLLDTIRLAKKANKRLLST